MRPHWSSLVLGISALQLALAAKSRNAITDIRITACPEDNCSIPGFRKVPQDLNKYSRGNYVHLHFTDRQHNLRKQHESTTFDFGLGPHDHPTAQHLDDNIKHNKVAPITQIAVLQGPDADMGPGWEKLEGNLNDGNYGPVLTMFVQRDPDQAPIDSIVVKYGYDSHAAIGYDRLPLDLNIGTGGQWVYLYYKRVGPREPITQIATKTCVLLACTMDSSWTRINRPISTGAFRQYLYLFYKSVPGERPITDLQLLLDEDNSHDDTDQEMVDTGVRFKNSNVLLAVTRGEIGDARAIDNVAVELGANEIPFSWSRASFQKMSPDHEVPNWNAQIIYRSGQKALPNAPTLRFRDDGTFKIVQFADMHMATGPHMCFNAPSTMNCVGDINTLMMMERMLETERPDLVVFTGDNVDGLSSNDAYATILKYSRPVVERGIPWTIIFGNHDEEGDLSREEMIQSVQDVPYSLSVRGPVDISGTGNYILSIYNPKRRRPSFEHLKRGNKKDGDDDEEEEALEEKEKSRFSLYFLDSGAYSFSLQYPGYDWIKEDQIEWFRQQSKAITSQYRADDVPNALAFFHIPLPEYDLTEPDDIGDGDDDEDELKKRTNSKMKRDEEDRDERLVGDKGERVSSPSYNSGLFDAIFESRDVRAMTVGHDHLNEYCLDHRGIHLCYGGGIGYGTYGSAGTARRSRVFEIRSFGDRVETWKRLDDEDLSTAGHQTLFVGKKPVGQPESGEDSEKRTPPCKGRKQTRVRPQRMTDVFENTQQSGEYVMNGSGNW